MKKARGALQNVVDEKAKAMEKESKCVYFGMMSSMSRLPVIDGHGRSGRVRISSGLRKGFQPNAILPNQVDIQGALEDEGALENDMPGNRSIDISFVLP